MSQISIKNLCFSHEGAYDSVFSDVSLQLDTSWRLGLVGRNGRGKTTLLRLLCGDVLPDSGTVFMPAKCDYFPPKIEDESLMAIEALQSVDPNLEDWKLLRELDRLDVSPGALYQSLETLSGGEKTKILLAAIFLREGRFQLIDEPTNHLDERSRKLVCEYLSRKRGFILVSHDRDFLDGCIDHIAAINRSDIEVRAGGFSAWYQDKIARDNWEATENERLKKELAHLAAASRRTAEWADKVEASKNGKKNSGLRPDRGFIGHKSAKMMSRAKSAQERMNTAASEKSKLLRNTEKCEELKLRPLTHAKARLMSVRDFAPDYGNGAVCAPLSFEIEQGRAVALCGKNGCGKTSALAIAAGESRAHTGSLEAASGLVVSFVPQQPDGLFGTVDEFAQKSAADITMLKTVLNKLDFSRVQLEKDISSFSAGQKKKLLIARSLCTSAHLYIWDEPLNYIDLLSRIQLERLICEYRPTLLVAEHDTAFLSAISAQRIELCRAL